MKHWFCVLLLVTMIWDADAGPPNFVIIMVDDMGYAGVSCFGNPYFQTPEIDRLAAEGMRLVDFHCSGTVCSPTRTGLLTGRYQQRAGIEAVIHPASDHPEHRKGLREVELTFAESLKSAGYVTGLIGKWHQGLRKRFSRVPSGASRLRRVHRLPQRQHRFRQPRRGP